MSISTTIPRDHAGCHVPTGTPRQLFAKLSGAKNHLQQRRLPIKSPCLSTTTCSCCQAQGTPCPGPLYPPCPWPGEGPCNSLGKRFDVVRAPMGHYKYRVIGAIEHSYASCLSSIPCMLQLRIACIGNRGFQVRATKHADCVLYSCACNYFELSCCVLLLLAVFAPFPRLLLTPIPIVV